MIRPRTIRRVLKWVGTAVCALTLGMWTLSTRYAFTNAPRYAPKTTAVFVDSGNLDVMWISPSQPLSVGPMDAFVTTRSGKRLTLNSPWPAWGRMRFPAGGALGASTVSHVTIPIWLVFLPAFVLTAFLWWRDRRIPPGYCQRCGYDLTGNVSGRCPECGTEIKSAHAGLRLADDPKLRFDDATAQSRRDAGK